MKQKNQSYREILVDLGEKKKLMKIFKCSYPTIRKALRFEGDRPLYRNIRKCAIERGGIEVLVEPGAPKNETL
jgi:hypothetical protein